MGIPWYTHYFSNSYTCTCTHLTVNYRDPVNFYAFPNNQNYMKSHNDFFFGSGDSKFDERSTE